MGQELDLLAGEAMLLFSAFLRGAKFEGESYEHAMHAFEQSLSASVAALNQRAGTPKAALPDDVGELIRRVRNLAGKMIGEGVYRGDVSAILEVTAALEAFAAHQEELLSALEEIRDASWPTIDASSGVDRIKALAAKAISRARGDKPEVGL